MKNSGGGGGEGTIFRVGKLGLRNGHFVHYFEAFALP